MAAYEKVITETVVAESEATVYSLATKIVLSLALLVFLLSLAGIIFLFVFQESQDDQILSAFADMRQEFGNDPLTPEQMVSLANTVSVLRTDINGLISFLQLPTETLTEGGWCGNYARAFMVLARSEGYPVHRLHLRSRGLSHTLVEIKYNGKWRVVDPFFNTVYRLPNGELATYEDIEQAPSLSQSQDQLGSSSDPRLEKIYQRYLPRFPQLYEDSANLDLALNPSSLYHTGWVIIGYPYALVAGGGQRAILPYWLDRPEYLGIYLLVGVMVVTSGSVVIWRYRLEKRIQRGSKPTADLTGQKVEG